MITGHAESANGSFVPQCRRCTSGSVMQLCSTIGVEVTAPAVRQAQKIFASPLGISEIRRPHRQPESAGFCRHFLPAPLASVVIPLPRRSVAIIDRTNVAGQPASKGAAMPIPSYSYPPRDEVPYLDWFGPHFQSVFVALNPFIKIHGGEPFQNGNWTPPAIVARAKRSGKECAVTWAEVATLCGFETIAVVNQALRLTGSKRIAPEHASVKSTELLLKHCREGHLYPPDEGRPSSPFECFFSDFATAAGQHTVLAGDGHPARREQLPIPNLADPEQINEFSEFAALDGSFYAAIYTDYHYWLVCQTAGSLSKARPEAFFEGFYANAATNDFWGIGNDKRGE